MSDPGWRVFPFFLVRNTGIPFELIESLAFLETAAAADRVCRAEEAMAELQAELRRSFQQAVEREKLRLAGEDTFRALLAARKRISKSKRLTAAELDAVAPRHPELAAQLLAWNNAVACRDALSERELRAFECELPGKQARLLDIARDPQFQEAVFLLSPTMFHGTLRRFSTAAPDDARNARRRMAEKKVVAYLQRLCVKNERGSFFGPINYGEFRPDGEEALNFAPPGRMAPTKREVFLSFWAVETLAECIAREPEVLPYLKPLRNPIVKLRIQPDAKISTEQYELWNLFDGSRTVAEIARETGRAPAVIVAACGGAGTARLADCGIGIPPTVPEPLRYLRSAVAELPENLAARERWLAVLDKFEHLRIAFRDGDLRRRVEVQDTIDRLFEQITGKPAQRGAGEFYSDRLLLFEECAGSLGEFAIGGALAREIEQRMATPAAMWAAAACARWHEHQRIGLEVFASLSRGGATVPYLAFINAISKLENDGRFMDRLARFDSLLMDIVERYLTAAPGGHRAELSTSVVEPLRALDSCGESHTLISSPDIFLMASNLEALRSGAWQIVVGDVHDDWTSISAGACAYFSDRRREMRQLQDDVLSALPDGGRIATVLSARRHKDYCAEPPGVTIELSGRSVKPAAQVAPLSEVEVVRENGMLVLRHPRYGSWLRLCTGDVRHLAHWIFSWPRVVPVTIGQGPHTRRIEMNGVVIQREQWLLKPEAFAPLLQAKGPDLVLEAKRLQRRLGLPDCGFALCDAQPKPVFVDFRNFFLLELLQELVSRSRWVRFSEMLPGPEHLWLRDNRGRYCCELRTGLSHY